MLRSSLLDEQGELSDTNKVFFSLDYLYNVSYHVGSMRDNNNNTKGNEMKLIGLTLALVIGTIVAITICNTFSDVTSALQNGIVLIHVDGN